MGAVVSRRVNPEPRRCVVCDMPERMTDDFHMHQRECIRAADERAEQQRREAEKEAA